jgi:hypothetical protein
VQVRVPVAERLPGPLAFPLAAVRQSTEVLGCLRRVLSEQPENNPTSRSAFNFNVKVHPVRDLR